MPLDIGATTPITAFAATAASTALPPCSRIWTPACAARGDSAATTPFREITIERPCPRSCAGAEMYMESRPPRSRIAQRRRVGGNGESSGFELYFRMCV